MGERKRTFRNHQRGVHGMSSKFRMNRLGWKLHKKTPLGEGPKGERLTTIDSLVRKGRLEWFVLLREMKCGRGRRGRGVAERESRSRGPGF